MNFNEQPSGIIGANSPLIYQFYDAAYANTGFYYEVKVYVWTGTASLPGTPVATIHRKPDQYGAGRGWLDTHKIVQQYLSTETLAYGTYKPMIGSGARYTAMTVRGVWDSGATSSITSNYVIATNGFSLTSEGLNKNFGTKYLLTDQTSLELTTATESYYLWYDASIYNLVSCGTTSFAPTTVSSSSNRIQGVDVVQLVTAGGQWGTNTTITFTKIAGGTDTMPVNFSCPSKYGEVDVLFLNRYGVLDSYVFNAISRSSMQVKSETYESPIYRSSDLSSAWTYGVQVTQRYNVQTRDSIIVNSQFVPQSTVTVFQQMTASELVLIDNGSYYLAARVMDAQFQYKKTNTDKLIQYTFSLEQSQPTINKIVR